MFIQTNVLILYVSRKRRKFIKIIKIIIISRKLCKTSAAWLFDERMSNNKQIAIYRKGNLKIFLLHHNIKELREILSLVPQKKGTQARNQKL